MDRQTDMIEIFFLFLQEICYIFKTNFWTLITA